MSAAAPSPVNVRFAPEFKRNLHALAKKYRHIRSDVEPIIEQLQAGALPGDQVRGVAALILKVRVSSVTLSEVSAASIAYCSASKPQARSFLLRFTRNRSSRISQPKKSVAS